MAKKEGFTSSACNYRNMCLGHQGMLPGNMTKTSNIDSPSHGNSFYN